MNPDNIDIVLVHTTHSGNIGGVARAMKNMGLHRMTLVSPWNFPRPRQPGGLPRPPTSWGMPVSSIRWRRPLLTVSLWSVQVRGAVDSLAGSGRTSVCRPDRLALLD